MKKIAGVFLVFALLFAVPVYAELIVEKPELPKGYLSWPITFSASCNAKTPQIKISGWVNGEDSGTPLSPIINKAARMVFAVSISGKVELFAYLSTAEMSRRSDNPVGDLYFKTKDGWLKIAVPSHDSSPGAEELLKKLFGKIGVVPEDNLDNMLQRVILQCLGGPAKK